MKTITTTFLYFFFSISLIAQTNLKGKVTDQETGEAILFANVSLYQNGRLIYGVETDLEGQYFFNNIDPGKYQIEVTYIGYTANFIDGVIAFAGKTTTVDILMKSGGITLDEVVVTEYKVPLIQQDNVTSGATITGDQIRNMPTRNINTLASTSAGLSRKKAKKRKGAATNIKGSRNNNTTYYVDGIRVQGGLIPYRKPGKRKDKALNTENAFINPKKKPTSTFSIDVDQAAYSHIRRFIKHNQAPPKDIVRIEEMVNYFDYNYPGPSDQHPFAIHTEMSDCPWNNDHHLLKIGLQGKEVPTEDRPPVNIILLLDVSGSMDAPDRLPLAKHAFEKLIWNLQPKDQVAILTFDNHGQVNMPFTPVEKSTMIINQLSNIEIGGGTNGEAGLRLAYEEAEKVYQEGLTTRIVIASDGDFNIGAASYPEVEKLIEEKRKRGVYLSILGFGAGNFKDRKLNMLAQKGNGNYAYIDNRLEANKVLEKEIGQTIHIIAEDVKIQIDFDPDFVASYRLIGYETRLMADEDFEDDTKDAGELGPGHTVTALYELSLKKPAANVEIADFKLRYKQPKEEQSYFMRKGVTNTPLPIEKTSNNFRFAASVAAFGMLLQQSNYINNFEHQQVIKLAKHAKGEDLSGYRQEFIELVKGNRDIQLTAKKLNKK